MMAVGTDRHHIDCPSRQCGISKQPDRPFVMPYTDLTVYPAHV